MNLCHSLWMYLTLIGQQNVNGVALESWRFVVDYELRCQFINYYDILYLFVIDGIFNGYMLITIHELKPWVFFAFNFCIDISNLVHCTGNLILNMFSNTYLLWKEVNIWISSIWKPKIYISWITVVLKHFLILKRKNLNLSYLNTIYFLWKFSAYKDNWE